MNNITKAKKLIENTIALQPWVQQLLEELNKDNIKELDSMPQHGNVRDIRRNLNIHQETTIKGGISTIGIAETINVIKFLSDESLITIFGFKSLQAIILLYTNDDVSLFYGCMAVYNKDCKMKYIKVKWIHKFNDEPIELYSEIDDERNEIRKIEIYRNNKVGYATLNIEVGGTHISETQIPELEEIAKDSQFEPYEIDKKDFEDKWYEFVINKKYEIFKK